MSQLHLAGSTGAETLSTGPTAPCYIEREIDEVGMLRECEQAKWEKHVLNGASFSDDYV